MPILSDEVRQFKTVGGQNSKFGNTYAKINELLQPLDIQKKISHNVATAADLSTQAWKE